MIVFFGIRPLYFKFFRHQTDKIETGIKAYIGNNYKVTETINNSEITGRVQIGSESWRARSEKDLLMESGKMIKIIKVEGSTLIVANVE